MNDDSYLTVVNDKVSAMARENDAESDAPFASVTYTRYEALAVMCVGVPEIWPVLALMVMSNGNAGMQEYVKGGAPPAPVTGVYGVMVTPVVSVVEATVTVTVGATTIDSKNDAVALTFDSESVTRTVYDVCPMIAVGAPLMRPVASILNPNGKGATMTYVYVNDPPKPSTGRNGTTGVLTVVAWLAIMVCAVNEPLYTLTSNENVELPVDPLASVTVTV